MAKVEFKVVCALKRANDETKVVWKEIGAVFKTEKGHLFARTELLPHNWDGCFYLFPIDENKSEPME